MRLPSDAAPSINTKYEGESIDDAEHFGRSRAERGDRIRDADTGADRSIRLNGTPPATRSSSTFGGTVGYPGNGVALAGPQATR